MAEENNTNVEATKVTATQKQGATDTDLSEGQGTGGAPKAPVVSNKAPVVELTAEQKVVAEAKAKADQEAADKKAIAGDEDTDTATTEEAVQETKAATEEYGTYQSEPGNSAIAILKEAGVPPSESSAWFSKALETGDLSTIDVAAMTAKLGKDKTNAVLALAKQHYSEVVVPMKERVAAGLKIAGGEKNFVKVRDFIRKEAEKNPELKRQSSEWNKMFEINQATASLAVSQMIETYNKHQGNSSLKISMTHGDKAASVQSETEILDRDTYLAQIKVAEGKGDYAEANRLRSVRRSSRAAEQRTSR